MAQEMKHAKKQQQHEEMMRRRRATFMVILFVLVLIIALIIKLVAGNSKKDAENESSNKTSASDVSTDGKTNTETESTDSTGPPTAVGKTKGGETIYSDGSIGFNTDSEYEESHDYCVAVNRQMNVVTVYGKDSDGKYTVPVKAFACSCGKEDNETPEGTFEAGSDRDDWKHTWLCMVDDSYGQYTTQIESHIWFHSVCYTGLDNSKLETEEYNKLGTNASLGCVRLCCADAKWIYENVDDRGTLVCIYDSEEPGPLGKPETITIDLDDENAGWDPTDPDPDNPWNK